MWLFPVLSYSVFFLAPTPSSNSAADIYDLWLKGRAAAQGRSFLGLGQWVTSFEGHVVPKIHPKGTSIDICKPYCQKSKNRNISETIHPISPKSDDETRTVNDTLWVVHHYTVRKYNMADVRHLENWHSVIGLARPPDSAIHTKFGMPMQNEMPMTNDRSKAKPEVEFHYGVRSFSQTGSSYNSAVDWYIFTTFGTLRDLTFWRHAHYQTGTGSWFATSTAAILKIVRRHNYPRMVRLTWNLVSRCKMRCDDDWQVKIETGSRISICPRSFPETGSSYNSAVDWDVFTKFGILKP